MRSGKEGRHDFVEIVIFGRPEVFYNFLVDPNIKRDVLQLLERHKIEAPIYATQGDIEALGREYASYKGRALPAWTSANLLQFFRLPFILSTISNLADANTLIDF
jgi:hypothetical protein